MNKLLLIQTELKAPKSQFNSHGNYKYRNCEDILEAVKPLLVKYGCTLAITDEVMSIGSTIKSEKISAKGDVSKYEGEVIYIKATATLSDNDTQNIITKVSAAAGIDINKKGMDISQTFGASSSYARKYALNGLFLIDDTKDADATNTHGKDEPIGIDAELVNKLAKCKDITELQMLYSTKEDWSNAEKTLFTNRKKSLK